MKYRNVYFVTCKYGFASNICIFKDLIYLKCEKVTVIIRPLKYIRRHLLFLLNYSDYTPQI